MKTRLLIIVGIAVAVVVSVILFNLFTGGGNPAFPSGYPKIPQNDMYCWTQWWYVQNTDIDERTLISSLRIAISEFGPDFDISNREITVDHHNEETVVSVGGSWAKDKTHHEKLTSLIKDHMGNSETIRDDIVMCA